MSNHDENIYIYIYILGFFGWGYPGLKKKISPHVLRHSFATHLIENGANIISIQKMMGHENIVTTEKYLHVKKKHLIDSVLKYHPRN